MGMRGAELVKERDLVRDISIEHEWRVWHKGSADETVGVASDFLNFIFKCLVSNRKIA